MMFLKRHKAAVALVAVLGLTAGAYSVCGLVCPGDHCPITSIFSASTAYAGPGCSSSKSGAACDASSKASNVTAASAKSADGKTCSKEDCIKAIMAEKNLSRTEAEAVYTKMEADGSCHGAKTTAVTAGASGCASSKASAQTASASGCAGHATASFANATEKSCGDKEACIAKCMAEKGYTRAQAEECWAKCQSAKATQANVITGEGFTRESWIDAKVASGMTRADAEVAAAKAEASGEVKFITASASGCATKASASGSGCCASKAKTTAKAEETAPATATTVSTGGTK